jgi:hypothetical protein
MVGWFRIRSKILMRKSPKSREIEVCAKAIHYTTKATHVPAFRTKSKIITSVPQKSLPIAWSTEQTLFP